MSEERPSIKLKKNYFVYLKFGLLIFGTVVLVSTIFLFIGWFREEFLILQRFSGFLLFILMIFIFYVEIRSRYYATSKLFAQYPDDLNERTIDYDAIIVAHSKGLHSIGITAGIDNLVTFFQSKQYPYQIFHCYGPSDIMAVLRDGRAKYLWIFGHGWQGGVTFKEAGKISDLSIRYPPRIEFVYQNLTIEIPPLPLKKFIGQFHCNSIIQEKSANVPLHQILISDPKEEDYYVTDDEMNHFSVWFATWILTFNIHRTSVTNCSVPEFLS